MHALRVLEFDQVLDLWAKECQTSLSQVIVRTTEPSFDPEEVWRELAKTSEALGYSELPSFLGIGDHMGPLTIASKGGVIDASSLALIGRTLGIMRRAKVIIESKKEEATILCDLASALPHLDRLEEVLERSVDVDGEVRDEASPDLAKARANKAKAGQRIIERIQSYVSGKTRDLLSDPLYTTRNGRYVLPVKAENKGKIRGIVHDSSGSGQTVYLEPEDVIQLGNLLREAEATERTEIERVLRDLSERVGDSAPEILSGLEAVTELDKIFARVRLGEKMDGCLPQKLDAGATIEIVQGRHPLLAKETTIPLSLSLGRDHDVILITGPNTGGKTVAIKTVGLFIAMAQCGLMVPAFEMKFGVFRQIWADIGDEQSLQQSLSTFSGHIKNISHALKYCVPGALILLDEIGAGTDPSEGASLARAILLEFRRKGCKIMASTHYGELKIMATNEPGFVNSAMEFDLKSLRPTYRFMMGTPGSSHALKIAARYGVPDSVIAAASEGLTIGEKDVARMIEKLETAQRQAQKAQSEADKLTAKLRAVEKEAAEKVRAAEEARQKVRQRVAEELEDLLRTIRLEASEVFESIKKDSSPQALDQARKKLRDLQQVGSEFVSEMKPALQVKGPSLRPDEVRKGMTVRILGFDKTGVVLEDPRGKNVTVQVGPLKMQVGLDKISPTESPKTPKRDQSLKMRVAKAATIQREIHLRQMRAEEAIEVLDKFFDDALLAGANRLRIVHGKGDGVLRKITQDFLRRHPAVKRYSEADALEGGQGATIAELE
ncbi:MAG: endonuclease MutS2 [Fimbriimonadaceae bacterium]|jgi:DNA mismatch repair protein MutS2|nr:endonuclease MutS2 [Fimbriimonadaceae bacterium]